MHCCLSIFKAFKMQRIKCATVNITERESDTALIAAL